jgi:hypothetical protein
MPNKEQMASDPKSKKGAITIAIENNPCGLCRAMGYPICKGHGGGSGGGGDSGETKNKDVAYAAKQVASTLSPVTIAAIREFDKAKTIWMQSQLSTDKTINYEAGLFSIESDRLRGNLTFRVNSGLSKAEIEIARKFLNVVKAEFDKFKDQLTEQGVSTKDFSAVIKDNELAIHIPNQKYYDAFIKHLENKNLLPTPNPEKQEKKELASESIKQEKNRPSPFDDILKGPKPKGLK